MLNSVNGLFIGDLIKTIYFPLKFFKFFSLGSKSVLRSLMESFFISSLSFNFKKKFFISKASGCYCQILTFFRDINLVLILLPSKKTIYVSDFSVCLVGRSGNFFRKYIFLSTHSDLYHLNKKPTVRGVAKNPVDHPHGGRTKTIQPEVSPWGWVSKYSH